MVRVQQWAGKGDAQGNESDLGFRISPFPDRLTIGGMRIFKGGALIGTAKAVPFRISANDKGVVAN
jgi:hypothetical protein